MLFTRILRPALAAAALGALLVAPAAAQSKVEAELFHRVDGSQVRVALRFEVERGFHVYHPTAGPGFALPTTVTLTAPGVDFGEAVFPAPKVEVQKGLGAKGADTFVWSHEGRFWVVATGELAEGAAPPEAGAVEVEVEGQVCDPMGCLPFEIALASSGAGVGDERVDGLYADVAWGELYADWPLPLDALEPRVLTALGAGAPAAPIVRQALAGLGPWAAKDAAAEAAPAAAQEAAPPKPAPVGGFGGFGLGGPPQNAYAELYTRVDGARVLGVLRFEVDEGFHLYHPTVGPGIAQPTVVELDAPGVRWGDVVFPEPEPYPQPGLGAGGADTFVWGHHGTFAAYVVGELEDGATAPAPEAIEAAITGQTCDENGCVPYDDELTSEGDGAGDADVDALFAAVDWDALYDGWPYDLEARAGAAYASLGLTPPAGQGGEPPADGGDGAVGGDTGPSVEPGADGAPAEGGGADGNGLWELLALAIGGGLFALVMPCTYPMIPITISYFTKQAEKRQGSVLPLALVYGGGIVAMFTSIGLVVYLLDVFAGALGMQRGDAGSAIIAFAISGWFNLIVGLAFVYFALVLFGAINLQPPAWAMRLVGSAQGKGGVGGLFLMGLLLVVTSFTCTGPFVGSILGAAAQQGGTRVLLGMFVFGLTLATPFVLLSLVPGKVRSLPTAGAWMNTLKVTLGFVELAAALKFFSNVDLAWGWGAMPRELFLWLWAVLAFVIAAFLFGFVKVKGESGEIGPLRMATAACFAMLGAYFGYGALGNQLGGAMTALAPPYSNRLVNQPKIEQIERRVDAIYEALSNGAISSNGLRLAETGPVIVRDDLEAAAQKARDLQRGLLINFTGHV